MKWGKPGPIRRPSGFIEPCIPTRADAPPAGPEWIHEIKHDGYRLIAKRSDRRVRLFTRRGYDWTDRFPGIADAVLKLRFKSITLDGEAVVTNKDGIADFEMLRWGVSNESVFLFAFDLLELDGEDLRSEPVIRRKMRLSRLLQKAADGIRYVDHLNSDADLMFEHVCKMGLEGIVSKRRDSRYQSGRSRDWIKAKNPNSPAMLRLQEE
jgi:ATP-dependent DNA ligase